MVVHGPDAGSRIVASREPSTIGRGRDSSLVLRDRSVSRRHLEVVATISGLRVRSLEGAAPFLIGESEHSSATLAVGDKLMIGDTLLAVFGDPPGDDVEITNATTLLSGMAADAKCLAAIFALSEALDSVTDTDGIQVV